MKIGLKLYLRLIFTAVILIPTAVILTVGGFSLSSFASDMMEEEIGIISYAEISGVKNIFDEYSFSLKSLSRMTEVQETAKGRYNDVSNEINAQIINSVENNGYIFDMIITDQSGVVCADYAGRQTGSIFSGFNENVTGVNRNEVYVSEIIMGSTEYTGENIIFFIHQIREHDNLLGYVSFAVSVKVLSDYLTNTSFFEKGRIFITDSRGTAVNLDNKALTRFEEIENRGIAEFVSQNKGTASNMMAKYEPLEAGGYIGCYGGISATNWAWFGIYPTSDVSAIVSDTFMLSFFIILAVCALCVIIMLFISQYAIKPMHVLIEKMRRIAGGNRDERFEITGSIEYARMGATFNEMIAEVSLSEELHRTISELSDNMLFEWDFNKEIMFVSDNFLTLFEINPKNSTLLNGHFLDSLMEDEFAEKYKRDINKILKTKVSLESEYKILTKTGGVIWISMRAHCITDRLGEFLRVVGVITNINNEKKLTLQLAERASYDFLSQLYNRTTFERELQNELSRSVTSRAAVIFIDVDDFKNINDKYGHSTGDEIIKFTSRVIKEIIQKGGFAGRFGGDEFIMCITDEEMIDGIDGLAKDLIAKLQEGYYSEQYNTTLKVNISIGVALAPQHGKDPVILIASADEAMYFVKKNGKNDYHIYAPDDSNLIDMMHSI